MNIMTRYLSKFGEFIKAVFWESWQKAFTFFGILGIIQFFFPNFNEKLIREEALARTIGGSVFFISFLIANFVVYLKLTANQAEIRLKVAKQHFNPSSSGRSPFRAVQSSPYGFNKQGLPDWASLYAEIEIANIGYEEGKLVCELDQSKTKLPSLFNCDKTNIDFHPPSLIAARQPSGATLFFDVLFSEQDPQAFAVGLKTLVQSKKRYTIVINYWTKRVDGESHHRELNITGNFNEFYKQVSQHWDNFTFADLARIGRVAEV